MLPPYFTWHFTTIPIRLLKNTLAYQVFFFHYFSIPSLFKTFFSPWRRQIIAKGPGFNPQKAFEVLSFNFISRFVGAGFKTIIFLSWLLLELFVLPTGLTLTLLWFLLPLITWPFYFLTQKNQDPAPKLITAASSPTQIFQQLLKNPPVKILLQKLSLNPVALTQIPLGQEHEKLFPAFLKETFPATKNASSPALLLAFFRHFPTLSRLLTEKNLTLADLETLALHREGKQAKSLFADRLRRIPSLGRLWNFGYTPTLDQYVTELTQPQSFAHQLVGRNQEVSQITRVLTRQQGNSLLLVGEPGVGRNTIVLQFAQTIYQNQSHPRLLHKRVLLFNLDQLLGQQKTPLELKGQLETILAEADAAGNIILMIKNIHQYLTDSFSQLDLSSIFAQSLSQDNFQIIGITDPANFAKFIFPQKDLLKHFEKIDLQAPTKKEALAILLETSSFYEKRNRLLITYPALKEIINKADEYVTEIPFPEKAIDLLDESSNQAANQNQAILTPQIVNQLISQKTRIPIGDLTRDEKEKLQNIESFLAQKIIDQTPATQAIAKALRRRRLDIGQNQKPIGSFLFLGPTGVGKTETAKALAQSYFGHENRLIRFDMSEYQRQDSLDRVIGSNQTNTPGLFAQKIRENPFSLLLLDEIEKAHPQILNLFLSLLDEGFFTDHLGKKVDCRHLIIIATSNAGSELIRKLTTQNPTEDLTQSVLDHVQEKGLFTPEFLNRFDAIVVFKPLSPQALEKIARLQLEKLNLRLAPKQIKVKITPELTKALAQKGYQPEFGARPMKRLIQNEIEDQIAQKLLNDQLSPGAEIDIQL